jgi:hypothetical protein
VKIGFRFLFLKAYGCEVIDLAHDFYEVDCLPENDRVRYTILPDARKEVLNAPMKNERNVSCLMVIRIMLSN